eukprot:TRINITY_DN9399_c0_g1_i1.p1 TRINITY_DN9399_c0_g1~~TRINITY_DN9399_c0_g1_i1.p1  ORF type:complete len:482 (+),score=84.63 TRINITY_DN9399_c0_g1_i1:100-1545(+)
MIVQFSTVVTFSFYVGSKYCVAKFEFSKGDDTESTLKSFFKEEAIPHYLERDITTTLEHLITQQRKLSHLQSDAVVNIQVTMNSGRILARQYALTTATWDSPTEPPSPRTASSLAKGSSGVTLFSDAYHLLFMNSKWRDTLQRLEKSYSLATKQLHDRREEVLESMRVRQAEEMEKESRAGSSKIPDLVRKHIQEMDKLEQQWLHEIVESMNHQKEEYTTFVINTAESLTPEEHFEVLESGQAQGPPNRIDSISLYLGSQLKTQFHVILVGGDLGELLRERASHSPYSNELGGCLLLTDPNLSTESKQNSDFIRTCNSSTEFHFQPVLEQLESLRNELSIGQSMSPRSTPLMVGDFVITKHSNLGNINLVFHFVVEKKSNNNVLTRLQQGLRNLLIFASKHSVHTLSVPVSLIPREDKHLFSEQQYLKHIESSLKTIRAFLLETSNSRSNSLKNIQLLLPPKEENLFEPIKSLIYQVIKQT